MLDPKYIRSNLEQVMAGLAKRGEEFPKERYENLENQRKVLQIETEDYQKQRNTISKQIGQAKAKGESTDELMAQVSSYANKLDETKEKYEATQTELDDILMRLPNIPHDSVPQGKDETENEFIREWGEKPSLDFQPKEHYELGEALNQMDFDVASKVTGSRFVVLHRDIAKLHRALARFMLETHVAEHSFNEVYTPYIVNADSMFGTGQLPNLEGDQFKIRHNNADFYLIPTAEVSVTNLFRDEIVNGADLPMKFVCQTPCFRSEAGSYGKDTKGMLRQHQFEKVEMVVIAKPEDSWQLHEELTGYAEKILQKLNLHYRLVNLCTGDLGFSSAKTYDLEVWLPGQDTYREISSCSNFEDFQARRMKARYRMPGEKQTQLVHTLNGSGLAVGRTLIAIMENYQNADGSIRVPDVLIPYMDGLEIIK